MPFSEPHSIKLKFERRGGLGWVSGRKLQRKISALHLNTIFTTRVTYFGSIPFVFDLARIANLPSGCWMCITEKAVGWLVNRRRRWTKKEGKREEKGKRGKPDSFPTTEKVWEPKTGLSWSILEEYPHSQDRGLCPRVGRGAVVVFPRPSKHHKPFKISAGFLLVKSPFLKTWWPCRSAIWRSGTSLSTH